jgi:hypothetical protein
MKSKIQKWINFGGFQLPKMRGGGGGVTILLFPSFQCVVKNLEG